MQQGQTGAACKPFSIRLWPVAWSAGNFTRKNEKKLLFDGRCVPGERQATFHCGVMDGGVSGLDFLFAATTAFKSGAIV